MHAVFDMSNFHPLVGRGSQIQLEVGEKVSKLRGKVKYGLNESAAKK